jgi:hypothetical protein
MGSSSLCSIDVAGFRRDLRARRAGDVPAKEWLTKLSAATPRQ